ncbi:oxidoreductase [Comamonas koreensis]|uniref:Oxidoreductase n=1 Tax=Comamonas koreensis TaxID=160825 RepID=A0AAW4XSU2_9BURK|nr:oxidoreductase [Comamonas koreensis]MCD2164103.1 oxidoreductase [Comamonas koreensis]
MRDSPPKTFFITGVSSGFGRALSQAALAAGHRVIGTVRSAEDAQAFQALHPSQAIARQLDVSDHAAVEQVAEDVEMAIGPVDVLVNNAGYGYEGILEESPLEDMRRQFDVNVFGAVAVIKAFLPFMRTRRRGRILNITSMGGFITMPGIAYYCGSKFALEGISEALGKEVAALGIDVTAVAPGSFRTDWAGRSMVRAPRSISDYDMLFDPVRARRQATSGKQLGDPAKAAAVMLRIATAVERPPAHLVLGSDALKLVRGKLSVMQAELAQWEALSCSTDSIGG